MVDIAPYLSLICNQSFHRFERASPFAIASNCAKSVLIQVLVYCYLWFGLKFFFLCCYSFGSFLSSCFSCILLRHLTREQVIVTLSLSAFSLAWINIHSGLIRSMCAGE
eukprot:170020_1